jgi:hypothetical protein
MRELDETIRARQTQGFDAASRIVLSNAGKKIMHRRKGGKGGCSRLCRYSGSSRRQALYSGTLPRRRRQGVKRSHFYE